MASEAEARAALERATRAGAHDDVIRAIDGIIAFSPAEPDGPSLPPDSRALLRASVDGLTRERAAALYPELAPMAWPARLVAYRMAFISEHLGDDRAAASWLARAERGAAPLPSEWSKIVQMAAEVRQRMALRARVDTGTIAVLLPLSGRFARLGSELRLAIAMAQPREGSDIGLVFLDTQGTPAGARAAVDRALSDHGALAILGPVGELEAAAAAARASELGVPIALLAPGQGDENGADSGVFRVWSSPGWEAREAVRIAEDLGYDRLAVLAPRDEHGQAATRAFLDAAAARKVEVVAVGDYDPTASDLEPDIKKFLGLDPRDNPRLAAHLRRHGHKRGWSSFSPEVRFDLLYIPDEYQHAGLVASYLPYFNVEVRTQELMDVEYLRKKHRGYVPQVVQLLGSSGWHHPGVITRGGSAVDGALVLDVYAGSDAEDFSSEAAARFAEAFDARVGRFPSPFSAQAFDAALLVVTSADSAEVRAHRSQGRTARAAMARALAGARIDDGACGPAQMGAGGIIERAAVVLRIGGGSFGLHEY